MSSVTRLSPFAKTVRVEADIPISQRDEFERAIVDIIAGECPRKLQSTRLALRRIAARVREGGHNVPRSDVIRRFSRGWENFKRVYQPLADVWTVYDNSGREPRLLEKSE